VAVGIWALGFGLWDLGFGIWVLGFGFWDFFEAKPCIGGQRLEGAEPRAPTQLFVNFVQLHKLT
jgi:hypothetical protein